MKYVLGVLGVIMVAVLAIVLITRGGGGGGSKQQPLDVSQEAREGVSAVLTTQGALVGEDQRRAIRITVSQDERRLEILTGYEEAVEKAQTYANTPAAFEAFLTTLHYQNFERQRKSDLDPNGTCPSGQRYFYELKEFSQDLLHSWNTSCSYGIGTFAGNSDTIRKLFERQITDYQEHIQGVDLASTTSK